MWLCLLKRFSRLEIEIREEFIRGKKDILPSCDLIAVLPVRFPVDPKYVSKCHARACVRPKARARSCYFKRKFNLVRLAINADCDTVYKREVVFFVFNIFYKD